MKLWDFLIRSVTKVAFSPWDADTDDTIRYLRAQRVSAEREADRLARAVEDGLRRPASGQIGDHRWKR